MTLVTAGLMNKQIAGKIGLSEITVKIHRGHAMRKMKARSLADLVRMAEALGLDSDEIVVKLNLSMICRACWRAHSLAMWRSGLRHRRNRTRASRTGHLGKRSIDRNR